MPTARKLPSGNYRVRVDVGRDPFGKRIIKSFTAPTKRDAERLAYDYVLKHRPGTVGAEMSVAQAVKQYIDIKEAILSPSTIRAYRSMERTAYEDIGIIHLSSLNEVIIQRWVSKYAGGRSPKRVGNAYGLLKAAVRMFDKNAEIDVTLPTRYKKKTYVPSDDDVQGLLRYINARENDDGELCAAVMLAAFGCLRRSEICALTGADIDREHGMVSVTKAMIRTEDRKWIIKPPKTPGSMRDVPVPPSVMAVIPDVGPDERIIKATPDQISHRFDRALKAAKINTFRFHDLRHYAASALHAWGVPDSYIMKRGGWSTDYVMKTVYRGTISTEEQRINQAIAQRIDSIVGDTM